MAYYHSPFRSSYEPANQEVCPFCAARIDTQTIKNAEGFYFENEHYHWVVNTFPKFEGHTMLIPKTHLIDLRDETAEAVLARQEITKQAVIHLLKKFPDHVYELFLQTGAGSAGSVKHLHWHLVPASPTDELRSFEKLGQFYTTKADEEKIIIFPKTITMSPEELLTFLSS